uniref:Uncharacterized protein n=1 Tax=Glossina palpalis gambiensis TaxID=67801 RepID=A0A1B0BPQ4_9MUSC
MKAVKNCMHSNRANYEEDGVCDLLVMYNCNVIDKQIHFSTTRQTTVTRNLMTSTIVDVRRRTRSLPLDSHLFDVMSPYFISLHFTCVIVLYAIKENHPKNPFSTTTFDHISEKLCRIL